MPLNIDHDHRRFRQIVRGKIRENLRKYITHGEMIGRKGHDLVSIPLPQLDVPHFRYGKNGSGGAGQGEGEVGQPIAGGGGKKGRWQRRSRQRSRRAHSRSRCHARRTGRHPRRRTRTAAHRAQRQSQHQPGKIEIRQHPPHRPRIVAAPQTHLFPSAAAANHHRQLRSAQADRSCRFPTTSATAPGAPCRNRKPTRWSST